MIDWKFIQKKYCDILRLARYWRLLTFRKFIFLWHILNHQERRFFFLLVLIIIISGLGFTTLFWRQITVAVPGVGKTYTEGIIKEPRTINPIWASQDAERDLSRLIFSGLLAYSGDGKIEPDLAESYEISKDGKNYTVALRKNALWHDGKKITADDVLFTIKTIQNPQYKSVVRANWQGVTVEKLDDYTLRFNLRIPYSPFIENLTVGILPKHLWENVAPEKSFLHELNLKPVGSGPYEFDGFKQEKDGSISWYKLSRNSRYYREGPYLKTITFVFLKSEEGALTAWRKGLIDGFGPISAFRVKEFDKSKVSLLNLQMPRIFGLFFNQKQSPMLADKKVREAIYHALNKEDITKQATAGGAIPVDKPLPFFGGKSAEEESSYNPELSQKLLKEAGWQDSNSDGILEKIILQKGKKVSAPLRFTLTTSDWPDLIKTAEIIKDSLHQVGIEIVIDKKAFNDLENSVIRPRNFDMLLFGEVYGYEPDPFAFWHSSQIKDPGLNVALYSNKKADQILEEARRLSDPITREQKYEELTKIINHDLPVIFLYSQLYLYLLPSNIQGTNLAKISLPADRFNEINKWYIRTRRVLK